MKSLMPCAVRRSLLAPASIAWVPAAAAAQSSNGNGGSGGADFNDSHFHLTNYIQEGIDIGTFLEIMGTRVGRSTFVRHPPAADLGLPQLG
jgi:hypothetical protein